MNSFDIKEVLFPYLDLIVEMHETGYSEISFGREKETTTALFEYLTQRPTCKIIYICPPRFGLKAHLKPLNRYFNREIFRSKWAGLRSIGRSFSAHDHLLREARPNEIRPILEPIEADLVILDSYPLDLSSINYPFKNFTSVLVNTPPRYSPSLIGVNQ